MTNILAARFRNHTARNLLKSVEIRQKFGNHTLAYLDYEFRGKAKYLLPKENTPGSVRWGDTGTGVPTFYGYVNHYDTVPTSSNSVVTRLVMLGTSRPMNSSIPTTWNGITYSGIAKEIAKRHRLRSVVHAHPRVLDSWTTTSMTDFIALQTAADEAGYRVWVDGSTVYFLDPKKTLSSAQNMYAPMVTKKAIRKTQVTGGSGAPRETRSSRRRIQYGLDYMTNELFSATGGDPARPTEMLDNPTSSFAEARAITGAYGQNDDDVYSLKMTVDGNANPHPGGLALVAKSSVNTDSAGYWVVTEAVHRITRDDFTTDFVATRRSNASVQHLPKTTITGVRSQVASVIRDGSTWESEVQEHLSV